MTALTLSLTLVFFFLALTVRALFRLKVCALCVSVTLTWITLALAHMLGWLIIDPIILAAYMGGTAVGVMYLLAARIPEKYHVFKFPFLLTLLWFIVESVRWCIRRDISVESWAGVWIQLVVWLVTFAIYLRRDASGGSVFKRLIDCCKNW